MNCRFLTFFIFILSFLVPLKASYIALEDGTRLWPYYIADHGIKCKATLEDLESLYDQGYEVDTNEAGISYLTRGLKGGPVVAFPFGAGLLSVFGGPVTVAGGLGFLVYKVVTADSPSSSASKTVSSSVTVSVPKHLSASKIIEYINEGSLCCVKEKEVSDPLHYVRFLATYEAIPEESTSDTVRIRITLENGKLRDGDYVRKARNTSIIADYPTMGCEKCTPTDEESLNDCLEEFIKPRVVAVLQAQAARYLRPGLGLSDLDTDTESDVERGMRPVGECAICLEEMFLGASGNYAIYFYKGCGHWFHKNCSGRELEDVPTCPLCRASTSEGIQRVYG